jgi:DNA-binding LytR/AlgR family response regulator
MNIMIEALYRPLRGESVLLTAAGLIVATAVYCIAYNSLAGQRESLAQALLWGLVNIAPWYLAFEAAKRVESAAGIVSALASALAASMLLQFLTSGISELGFELVRRIPALVLVLALLASGRLLASARAVPVPQGKGRLPLSPNQVDWVSAAGNYVELRAQGRTILHRAPLSHVQAELERHGFVRIHRSILVRRERIARVRPRDVVLEDGTCLRTGKRYRASLH